MKTRITQSHIIEIIRQELRNAMREYGHYTDRFDMYGDSSVTFYHPKRSESRPDFVAESKINVDQDINYFQEALITRDDITQRKSTESFSERVLHLIDAKNMKDSDVYKAAGIDRRLFSKLRSNKDYQPTKTTALVLCLALRLSPGEARDLLELAGYSFSRASGRDIVVQICLEHRIYPLMEVNNILHEFLYEPF